MIDDSDKYSESQYNYYLDHLGRVWRLGMVISYARCTDRCGNQARYEVMRNVQVPSEFIRLCPSCTVRFSKEKKLKRIEV